MSRKADKSACLPYCFKDGKIKMLFMKPSNPFYGGSYFQLAKGMIDSGYTPEETARKESLEELGLSQDNTTNFKFLFRDIIKHKNGRNHKLYVYTTEVINPDKLLPYHYETGEVQWLSIDDVKHLVRKCQWPIIYKVFGEINAV